MSDVDIFLEHYGVKGMRWGVRKGINNTITRRKAFKEVKRLNKIDRSGFKEASKDPTFKREVKATRKGKGITGTNRSLKKSKDGLLYGNIMGDFKNSKGEKVSVDFANAVMTKAVAKNDRATIAKIGAAHVAAALITTAVVKRG